MPAVVDARDEDALRLEDQRDSPFLKDASERSRKVPSIFGMSSSSDWRMTSKQLACLRSAKTSGKSRACAVLGAGGSKRGEEYALRF